MGLGSLSSALSGLSIAQAQIDIISSNVANVSTLGYTRKILPQSTQSVNGVSIGVTADTIIRQVDLNLSRDLWTQVSSTGVWDVKESYLSRINGFHGPPDKEISFASRIEDLYDEFLALSDSPESTFLQAQTVSQAQETAAKINEYANLITTLRNDIQSDIQSTITRVNGLIDQIASLNNNIASGTNVARTTANSEDLRDNAIRELSELMEITFFQGGDGRLIIQTNQGLELASNRATHLTFSPQPLSPNSFYPDSAAGIYVGNPVTDPYSAVDISTTNMGGKLGGLLELRDASLSQQMAQLDELAHKMATRFEDQGLALFTDDSGLIPGDTPPDLSTSPITAVGYVGFASNIQVNQAIINDNTLLQTGTNGAIINAGSNEVISRVIENVFGRFSHEEAIGGLDLSLVAGGSLQDYLGIVSENKLDGGRDLSGFASTADIIAIANNALDPGSDTFRITFEEPDLGLGPIDIDIELGTIADGPGDMVQDIIDHITGIIIPGLPAGPQADLAAMNVQFSQGANGQLVIESQGNITIDATGAAPANSMGETGLTILGLVEGTTEATDPYFEVQVGNKSFERIYIEPSDDETDLLAKLQAVTGLAVEDFTSSADGFLRLRPGEDYADPLYGGNINIVSGSFTTSGSGAGAALVPDGINLVSALFGSWSAGPPAQDSPVVTNASYSSEVSNSDSTKVSFREEYLGPGGNISTEIVGTFSLADYAKKMINQQSQEFLLVQSRIEDSETLQNLLQDRLLNETGVNLDQELSHLIVVQSSYAASARVITAVQESFQDLLRIFN